MHQGLAKRKKNDFWRVLILTILVMGCNAHAFEITNLDISTDLFFKKFKYQNYLDFRTIRSIEYGRFT